MVKIKFLVCFFLLFPFLTWGTEIYMWHGFDGFLQEVFEDLVEDFNQYSGKYRVVPIKKGNYQEVVEKGISAFGDQKHPHILQVYEVATQTLMLKHKMFKPIDELMKKYHKHFDPDVYIDAVRYFYSSNDGRMISFPWNASTGILFYNRDLFSKVGLDPSKPPKTWDELQEMGEKIVKAGYKGFTTAWPAAYHLEHFSALHNLPFATAGNGFEGLHARLAFNSQAQIFHLGKLTEWQKQGVFSYSGRYNEEPEQLFAQGKCAILLQGANRLPLLNKQVDFSIGVGFMPYWSSISSSPFNLNIGGTSFWIMEGFSEEEYRGVALFLEYLSSTEIQTYWHQKTGYLPITEAAYYLAKKKGFYKKNPAAEIAVLEVMNRPSSPYTKGVRLGDYIEVRNLIIDHLEKALDGELSPKEALDQAVIKGNILLEDFQNKNS